MRLSLRRISCRALLSALVPLSVTAPLQWCNNPYLLITPLHHCILTSLHTAAPAVRLPLVLNVLCPFFMLHSYSNVPTLAIFVIFLISLAAIFCLLSFATPSLAGFSMPVPLLVFNGSVNRGGAVYDRKFVMEPN
jgi:hypothetical protein